MPKFLTKLFFILALKNKILKTLQVKRYGAFIVLRIVINYLVVKRRIQGFDEIKPYLHGKNCLEIGGPKPIFQTKSIMPICREAKIVDNCNFSSQTVWEGNISGRLTFIYTKKKVGCQFICEATDLKGIKGGSYNCVISSHVLIVSFKNKIVRELICTLQLF